MWAVSCLSEDYAFGLLGLGSWSRAQDGSAKRISQITLYRDLLFFIPDGLVKDALQVSLGEGRALHVLDRLNLLGNCDCLLVLYRCHLLLSEALLGAFIIPQVQFGSDKDDGYSWCVMLNLGEPLQPCQSDFITLPPFVQHTFALTLSNDGGLTIEKQIRKTSVCG